jgi:hypothetical protein
MLERRGAPPAEPGEAELAALFVRQLEELTAWLRARPNFRVLRVGYPDLIRDAKPVAEEIDRFLGGGLDVAAMAAVVDPALYRQRA